MDTLNLNAAFEAILFSSGEPVSADKIIKALNISMGELNTLADICINKFNKDDSGIKIIQINDKYQMCSKSQYVSIIKDLLNINKSFSLSPASMEVLAVTAYNQPVTKGFIEKVRGVDCSKIINTLIEKDLISEKGRLDIPGRPIIYGVTENFFRCFGLSSLDELPDITQYIETRGKK